jgi:hypothetical protein
MGCSSASYGFGQGSTSRGGGRKKTEFSAPSPLWGGPGWGVVRESISRRAGITRRSPLTHQRTRRHSLARTVSTRPNSAIEASNKLHHGFIGRDDLSKTRSCAQTKSEAGSAGNSVQQAAPEPTQSASALALTRAERPRQRRRQTRPLPYRLLSAVRLRAPVPDRRHWTGSPQLQAGCHF